MILSRQKMQEIEGQTLARGISAESLMEAAGAKLARLVLQFFKSPGLVVCYAGKGNNAGDAFVAARHLTLHGWRVLVRTPFSREEMGALPRKKLAQLQNPKILTSSLHPSLPNDGAIVLLDGLVGLGSQGALREPLASLADEMNRLRRDVGAKTIAIDIPSGLDPDAGVPSAGCVVADITATIGFVKSGLVADAAVNFVGRLAVLELVDFVPPAGSGDEVITASLLRRSWRTLRDFDTHKGMCGRVIMLAGSRGMLGAAFLSTSGALRGGAGLVSLGALADSYDLLASSMLPEVMVQPLEKLTDVFHFPADAIGIGPGLGMRHQAHTLRIVREATCPTVVDADALTILAHAGLAHLEHAKGARLLTPHPGEMRRLRAGRPLEDRATMAREFVAAHPVTLLLKGARTVIAENGRSLRYNSTGNPAMATGGMGDVLTGVCCALLAQGADSYTAASLGAWLCGRAAEIALVKGSVSVESLLASDVISNLGNAFVSLAAGDF